MRRVHEAERHAVEFPVFLDYVFKSDGGKGRGGDSILQFQSLAGFGDRRYAARSTGHAANDGVAFPFDFLP